MNTPDPGADGAPGLMTVRECRTIFRIGERDMRRALHAGKMPFTVINGRAMISPADAVESIRQWGRRHG